MPMFMNWSVVSWSLSLVFGFEFCALCFVLCALSAKDRISGSKFKVQRPLKRLEAGEPRNRLPRSQLVSPLN